MTTTTPPGDRARATRTPSARTLLIPVLVFAAALPGAPAAVAAPASMRAAT
ncbi:hypothetical protein [Streptosporangium sp. KLBMP 9127]|nr:hypothetical protein [Streptosporangium sp. KLBMP 9127]